MDWNSLFEQWGAHWGSFSAVVLLALKSFILDPLLARKTQFNLSNFKEAQKGVKDEIKAYTKIMVDSFDDFKQSVVQPLLEEVKQKDYQVALANDIIISLLANSNVPLANKEQAFRDLSKLKAMNEQLLNNVIAQIEVKKTEVAKEKTQSTQVYDGLKEV